MMRLGRETISNDAVCVTYKPYVLSGNMIERSAGMAGIDVRDLRDDLSFGHDVRGLTWDNINDESVREELRQLFIKRGMLVFKDMEPTAKMQVAVSKIFGPLKDHPTTTTARDKETGDDAKGVIDMHYM